MSRRGALLPSHGLQLICLVVSRFKPNRKLVVDGFFCTFFMAPECLREELLLAPASSTLVLKSRAYHHSMTRMSTVDADLS